LCISKTDLQGKIPRDLYIDLEQNSKDKMKFLKRRILDKGAGDEMMSKWDIGHQSIIEKAHEVSKKYPKANT
jgi:hypothetical protein